MRKLVDAPPQPDNLVEIVIHSINVQGVTGSLAANKYIIPVGAEWSITASCTELGTGIPMLPDGNFIIIIEKTVGGTTPVDDIRALATVVAGNISFSGTFIVSGNYNIDPTRLSKGLQEIGLPVKLIFDKLEFDAYNG